MSSLFGLAWTSTRPLVEVRTLCLRQWFITGFDGDLAILSDWLRARHGVLPQEALLFALFLLSHGLALSLDLAHLLLLLLTPQLPPVTFLQPLLRVQLHVAHVCSTITKLVTMRSAILY